LAGDRAVGVDRAVYLPAERQSHAEAETGLDEVRLEADLLAECRLGTKQIARCQQADALRIVQVRGVAAGWRVC